MAYLDRANDSMRRPAACQRGAAFSIGGVWTVSCCPLAEKAVMRHLSNATGAPAQTDAYFEWPPTPKYSSGLLNGRYLLR